MGAPPKGLIDLPLMTDPELQAAMQVLSVLTPPAYFMLLFECDDDSPLDVTIIDPGSSVIVWEKNDQVEYLGKVAVLKVEHR